MIITTAIIKGGAGKSTTAAALLQAAAACSKRCLAIDLDPQANLTFFLSANQNLPGSWNILHGYDVQEVIQHTTQSVDVISGSPDLATETTRTGSAKRLAEAIKPIKDNYDLIAIDTPPTMGELTFNALHAATELLIPLEADNSSIQGLYQITDIARQMEKANPDLKILGTIVTRYDGRPKMNRFFLDAISEAGSESGAPFLKAIRGSIAVKEAQSMQLSLFDYAPRCNAAADYMDLYRRLSK